MMPTHTLRAVLLLVTSLLWPQLVWCGTESDTQKQRSPHTWFTTNPIFEGRVYLEEWGDPAKPAVILVHGLGNNGAKDWRHLAPLLSTAFHVITFDLPGFGRSSKANALYSPDNYARFVDWVATSYAKKPFILVGHSMGGVIALTYAAQHPDRLKQLLLINVAGVLHRAAYSRYLIDKYRSSWWSHLIPDTEQLERAFGVGIGEIDRFDAAFDLILANSFTRKIALGGDPAKIAGLAMVQKDFSGLLEQVTPPTTIIWGARDTIAPLRTGQILTYRLPNARLEIIPEAGHSPMHETREQLNAIIWESITRPGAPTPPKKRIDDAVPIKEERCVKQTERYYSGRYHHLILKGCQQVTLENATVDDLQVIDSTVAIYNSTIGAGERALTALRSTVFATATTFDAEIPLTVDDTQLDFAGVDIRARQQLFKSRLKSYAIFSLSTVTSPQSREHRHGVYPIPLTVTPQQ